MNTNKLQTALDYRLPDPLRDSILEKIMQDKVRELIAARQKLPAVSIESVLDRAPVIRSFKKALARHSLVMAWPRPDQIVRLSAEDFAFGRPADSRDRLQGYAKLPRSIAHD